MGIVRADAHSTGYRMKKNRSMMNSYDDRVGSAGPGRLPHLLTPAEVAGLLRTSKTAIYARIERGQLPGVVRVGRRVLVRESDLLEWLTPELPPSPER
jgi:excisionase family DNA binding protein